MEEKMILVKQKGTAIVFLCIVAIALYLIVLALTT